MENTNQDRVIACLICCALLVFYKGLVTEKDSAPVLCSLIMVIIMEIKRSKTKQSLRFGEKKTNMSNNH